MKLLMRLMVFAGIFYALPLSAQTVDLSSLYQKAVEYDAQVRAAKADYLVSKEEVNKAISQFRPNVRLSGARGRNETKSITPGYYGYTHNDQFYNSINYSVSVQQPLFNLSNYAGYKQAKAVTAKSDAVFQNEDTNLIVRITEAYCNALYAEDNMELSKAHIKASIGQLEQTKRRREKGYGTITEISEAQANYDMALADGLDTANSLEFTRRELEHFTGVYPDALCKLVPEKLVLERPVPDNVDSWIERSRSMNHQVAAAREEINIAKTELQKQRAVRYPTINLVGSRNYSESDNNYTIGSSYDTYSVSLQMSMPIYTGGYVSASVRQALSKRQKAQEQLSWQERGAESDIRKYYNSIMSSIAQIKGYEQAVKSGEIAFTGTKKGFEAGLRTNTDVLDAEQKLLSSKRNLAKSRYQYILSHLQLKATAGTLLPGDVDEVNSWLSVAKK